VPDSAKMGRSGGGRAAGAHRGRQGDAVQRGRGRHLGQARQGGQRRREIDQADRGVVTHARRDAGAGEDQGHAVGLVAAAEPAPVQCRLTDLEEILAVIRQEDDQCPVAQSAGVQGLEHAPDGRVRGRDGAVVQPVDVRRVLGGQGLLRAFDVRQRAHVVGEAMRAVVVRIREDLKPGPRRREGQMRRGEERDREETRRVQRRDDLVGDAFGIRGGHQITEDPRPRALGKRLEEGQRQGRAHDQGPLEQRADVERRRHVLGLETGVEQREEVAGVVAERRRGQAGLGRAVGHRGQAARARPGGGKHVSDAVVVRIQTREHRHPRGACVRQHGIGVTEGRALRHQGVHVRCGRPAISQAGEPVAAHRVGRQDEHVQGRAGVRGGGGRGRARGARQREARRRDDPRSPQTALPPQGRSEHRDRPEPRRIQQKLGIEREIDAAPGQRRSQQGRNPRILVEHPQQRQQAGPEQVGQTAGITRRRASGQPTQERLRSPQQGAAQRDAPDQREHELQFLVPQALHGLRRARGGGVVGRRDRRPPDGQRLQRAQGRTAEKSAANDSATQAHGHAPRPLRGSAPLRGHRSPCSLMATPPPGSGARPR
jgi:hypothetical protein